MIRALQHARRRALLLALLAGCLGPRSASAVEPDVRVESLLGRLEKGSAQVDTLCGEFTQKSRIKLFKQELSSTGRLYFQRPRRIRWQYLSPDPSTLILDGDQATLHAAGSSPQSFDLAKDAAMRAVFDQISLWLGAGSLASARGSYDLAASGSEAQPVLALTPRPGAAVGKTFARIELRFDARLLLRGILMREVSGDEKEITFSRMERNAKLPGGAFTP